MDRISGRRVLVSGATGLIGRHLVAALLDKGAYVIAISRDKLKLYHCFQEMLVTNKLQLAVGNISENFPPEIKGVDYIFHAAGAISSDVIREKPVEVIDANLLGIRNCLEFLRKQEFGRLIVFSSATVYGNRFDHEITVEEQDTFSCESLEEDTIAYSESKRMCEAMALAYEKQYDVDCVIARMSYVYGYSEVAPKTAFFSFIDSAINGYDIEIKTVGLPCRDNIFVEDVVNGLLIIAIKGVRGEAYNISTNGDLDNYKAMDQIAEIISEVSHKLGISSMKVKTNEDGHSRKPGMRMDNSKLKKLGWEVTTDIRAGVEKTLMRYANK